MARANRFRGARDMVFFSHVISFKPRSTWSSPVTIRTRNRPLFSSALTDRFWPIAAHRKAPQSIQCTHQDCGHRSSISNQLALDAFSICRCFSDVKSVCKVPSAMDIQSAYSPSLLDQNNDEPHWPQTVEVQIRKTDNQ